MPPKKPTPKPTPKPTAKKTVAPAKKKTPAKKTKPMSYEETLKKYKGDVTKIPGFSFGRRVQ